MELWIRTQDKMRLVKPNRLAIKRESRNIGEGDYYIYESQNSLRYGTYTTKERALEVLDEIQELDTNKNNIIVSHHFDKITKITYEMPKE